MRGGVLADEPLASQLRHACGLAGLVVGRGGALVLALGLALLLDAHLDRGGLGPVTLRLLALALQLGLDALLLEDGQALLELVELGLLGERLLGRLLGVGERALGESACAMRAEIGSSSTPWKSRARSAGARRMKLPVPQPGSRIAAGVSPRPMPASRSAS